jgi:hypothetical protein
MSGMFRTNITKDEEVSWYSHRIIIIIIIIIIICVPNSNKTKVRHISGYTGGVAHDSSLLECYIYPVTQSKITREVSLKIS